MKPIILRRTLLGLLFVLSALTLQAARQSHTVTSTFSNYSPTAGVLVADESGCNWTANPSDAFYYSQMGYSPSIAKLGAVSIVSAFTVTGTVQSIKVAILYGANIKITAKVGNTVLGSDNVSNAEVGTGFLNIPITNALDLSGQNITLSFENTGSGSQNYGYCEFNKIVVTYLDPKSPANLSFSSKTASATVGDAFTPPTLNNPNKLSVTWSSSTPSVATVNGSGAVSLLKDGTTTITASFAGNDDYLAGSDSYTLTVKAPTLSAPTFSLAAGTYDVAQTLTLTTNKQGADIYYSVDNGSNQKYTGPIPISKSCTVKAYTQFMGYKSASDSRSYVIRQPALLSFSSTSVSATLGDAFTPPTLSNPNNLPVTWTSSNTGVATVTNTGAVTILKTGTTVIKAAFAGDGQRLPVSASYTLTVNAPSMGAPTFSLASGTYDGEQKLTLSTSRQGAEIYYSIDNGSEKKYTGPIYISSSCTVKAYTLFMGVKSATDSRTYVIRQSPSLWFYQNSITVVKGETFTTPELYNPERLPLVWSSSNTTVATVSQGNLTIKNAGETEITARFSGNNVYQPVSASYYLVVEEPVINTDSAEVAGAYRLWVNGIRVTSKNQHDVLGDGKGKVNPTVMFDGNHTLVLSNADLDSIVSQLTDRLVVFVQGNNKVGNTTTPAIHHTRKVPIPLTITTSGNYPGTLTLTSQAGLISGFSETTVDNLMVLSELTRKAVYGPRIYPFTNNTVITFNASDFLIPGTGEESEEIDLSNRVVNNVLFTLRSENEDGFDEEESTMVLNTVMPLEPSFGDGIIGSESFADSFAGMTFMIPAGEGDIIIDNMSTYGYVMAVKIGAGQPYTFLNPKWTESTIHYHVAAPSYVYIYNAGLKGSAGDRMRGGKKTSTRIVVRSIVIKPQQVAPSNEVQTIISDAETIDMNPVIDMGISELHVDRKDVDSWYNLNGQKMDRPRQRGIYIFNGRKVIVK